MEIINSLLSNDIDYLNALRHAPSIPSPTPPAVAPPLPSTISLDVPAVGVKNAAKKFQVPTWAWITLTVVVATLIYRKWKSNKEEENKNSF